MQVPMDEQARWLAAWKVHGYIVGLNTSLIEYETV